MPTQIDVFVSYKREERTLVETLVKALRDEGFTAVYDVNVTKNEHFGDAIDAMVRGARMNIVLWTNASANSEWVLQEARLARDLEKGGRGNKYLGVMVEDVSLDLPVDLRGLQMETADEPGKLSKNTITRILNHVINELGQKSLEEIREATSVTQKVSDEFQLFEYARRIDVIEGYEHYLRVYPDGDFAVLAKNRLNELQPVGWIRTLTRSRRRSNAFKQSFEDRVELSQLNDLTRASPVSLLVKNGKLDIVNPVNYTMKQKQIQGLQLEAIKSHAQELIKMSSARQVKQDFPDQLKNYYNAVTQDNPNFFMLDGPMSILYGGIQKEYDLQNLDGAFIEGIKQLVVMHEQLRREVGLPELDQNILRVSDTLSVDDGIDTVGNIRDAFSISEGETNEKLNRTLDAAAAYFLAAKQSEEDRTSLLKKGAVAVGGLVALVVGAGKIAGSLSKIQEWLETDLGKTVLERFKVIWDRVKTWFGW